MNAVPTAIELEDVSPIEPKTAIGVDVGLKSLVALCTGEAVEYPRYYVQAENKLAVAQRNLSRKKKGSANGLKAKAKVAKAGKMVELVDARYTCLNIRTLGLRGRAYQDPTPTLCKSSKQVRSMT